MCEKNIFNFFLNILKELVVFNLHAYVNTISSLAMTRLIMEKNRN